MGDVGRRALVPGTTVYNRYKIIEVLGEGGFGITYLATDLIQEQICAMKEYMPVDIAVRQVNSNLVYPVPGNKTIYQKFCRSFLEEARIIYRYRGHPHIVDVYHLFYENNTAYYVMEYIDGMDLKRYIQSKGERLSWKELKVLIVQAVEALKVIHKDNIVHCDISPDNIYILKNGSVKLIDFGAAKSVLKGNNSAILMKRGFAPPEQLSTTGNIGPWTDIYALAVTIYRAYTGQMPPSAEERILQDHTIWPTEMGLALPHIGWEKSLKQAMSLKISERYKSVEEFWMELSGEKTTTISTVVLDGLQGYYKGKRVHIQSDIMVGTDSSRCQLVFPPGTPGVSRVHLCVWRENNLVFAMDMGSSYGTKLGEKNMTPGLSYQLTANTLLYFGDGQSFKVKIL